MTSVQEKLEAAIAALPDTADEIAEMLRKEGIHGRRQNVFTCPLSMYIRHHILTSALVYTFSTEIVLRDNGERVAAIDLPDPVFTFVDRFDHSGAYRFLTTAIGGN